MSRAGDYISVHTRALVAERAEFRCEYCQTPDSQAYSFYNHQVDHIRSLKHRGTNTIDNPAYACFTCNINKGPDVGSIHDETGFFWDSTIHLPTLGLNTSDFIYTELNRLPR